MKVSLPAYTAGCDADPKKVACDYPPYTLNKIVRPPSSGEGRRGGDTLIKNFTWTNADQNHVADYIANNNMTPDRGRQEVARRATRPPGRRGCPPPDGRAAHATDHGGGFLTGPPPFPLTHGSPTSDLTRAGAGCPMRTDTAHRGPTSATLAAGWTRCPSRGRGGPRITRSESQPSTEDGPCLHIAP